MNSIDLHHDHNYALPTSDEFSFVALNVCGLVAKYNNGVLFKYLENFDLGCLTETKTDSFPYSIPGYEFVIKEKHDVTKPYGGIHGIALFYKTKYSPLINMVDSVKSESVLWVRLDERIFGIECILGVIYVPHEGSKYYSRNVFDELEEDLIELKNKFDLPFIIAGDWNARTGLLSDNIDLNSFVDQELEWVNDIIEERENLEKIGVLLERYNQDKNTNNNGYKMLEICKTANLYIVNGRFGKDKYVGNKTFLQQSTIDYFAVSPVILPRISNFEVDIFDPLMSDRHHPIIMSVKKISTQPVYCPPRPETSSVKTITKWDKEKKSGYLAKVDYQAIQDLSQYLDELNPPSINQDTIDDVVNRLKHMYLEPARKSGMTRELKPRPSGNQILGRQNNKPWFGTANERCRKEYFELKKDYKRTPTEELEFIMKQKAKELKKLNRMSKRDYDKKFVAELRQIKHYKPQEYWKLIKNADKKPLQKEPVSINDFKDHFEHLNKVSERNIALSDNGADGIHNANIESEETSEILNRQITLAEVEIQIKKLKNRKACGIDGVPNELIKNSTDAMAVLLQKVFNLVFDTGIVPTDWTKGIIKPIYKKKGRPDDPNNYRGITLLSCIGKCFTAIINERLRKFVKAGGLIGKEQAGFREGHSTLDHIFLLYSILDLYLKNKKRLYCAFIDYQKAFDTIHRPFLWTKVLKHGINGKILTVIYNLYQNAKSCVETSQGRSDLFSCNVGVRQGENLSPLLFAIFLNDFNEYMRDRFNGLTTLNNIHRAHMYDIENYLQLFTLLYADDTIILAESPDDLQNGLDAVYEYCNRWQLTVNVDKTKTVIFSRGKVRNRTRFTYGGEHIETIDDYVYLGAKFNFNAKFNKLKARNITQSNRALFSLSAKIKKLNLPIDIQIELYDQLILPIMLYGCEVWGHETCAALESARLKFYKHMLRVNKSTTSAKVLGEVGKMKIENIISVRMLNFWIELRNDDNHKLSFTLYNLLKRLHDAGIYQSPWLTKIKETLGKIGMAFLWDQNSIDTNWFKSSIKQRIQDINNQDWERETNELTSCTGYRIFKCSLSLEKYLVKLDQRGRINMAKFRCGSNYLPINAGRYDGTPWHERKCTMCDEFFLGDEFHYLFECASLRAERLQYIKPYYRNRPNVLKMKQLFNVDSKKVMKNLARFCEIIMIKCKARRSA